MDSEWMKDDRRGIIEEVLAQREARQKADAQAEALAAEEATVYNLGKIRKLERQLEAQEEVLVLLGRLVERMGRDLDGYINADYGTFEAVNPASRYSYTLAGQRECDAAGHDAEGTPPTRESEGAWGYE